MTLQQLVEEGKVRLASVGIEEAELDARILLLESFQLTNAVFLNRRQQLIVEPDLPALQRYWEWIEQRSEHVPLQYIIGTQEFMGLSFIVNSHVLIPRQDTETMVEQILIDHPDTNRCILDLCTGSGCIAISLLVIGQYDRVMGLDISQQAINVARENAAHLCQEQKESIEFIKSDLFNGLKPGDEFDIIVSNPPYIPSAVISQLQPEVRDHEPLLALDGKSDGLYFYQKIIKESPDYLKSGGSLYLEVGHDQASQIADLLSDRGYSQIIIYKDLPGIERIVTGVWKAVSDQI